MFIRREFTKKCRTFLLSECASAWSPAELGRGPEGRMYLHNIVWVLKKGETSVCDKDGMAVVPAHVPAFAKSMLICTEESEDCALHAYCLLC